MQIQSLNQPTGLPRRLPDSKVPSNPQDAVSLDNSPAPMGLLPKPATRRPQDDPGDPRFGIRCGAFVRPDPFFSNQTQLVVHTARTGNNPEGIEEIPSGKLRFVATDQLLSRDDQVLIGFGRPRVSTLIPAEKGGYQRLDASPYFARKARVVSGETIQSGIFIRPRNLPPEATKALREAMSKAAGHRNLTSARANARMLTQAGFTSGGEKLSGKLTTFRLFRQIANEGLEFQGKPVQFDILSTTRASLDEHFRRVISDEIHSPLDPGQIDAPQNPNGPSKPGQQVPDDPNAPRIGIRNSRPGLVGSTLRHLVRAHVLWEALPNPKQVDINTYLPTVLKDKFHDDKPLTKGEKVKALIFKPGVVDFLRARMAKAFDDAGSFTPQQVVSMMRTPGEGEEIQPDDQGRILYNLVICGDKSPRGMHVTVARLNTSNEKAKADDILSKHVLLAGYDPDVRFAGECWAERYSKADGNSAVRLHINNNSGTYRPNGAQAQQAGEFLRKAFPGVEVVVHEMVPPPPSGKPDYLKTYSLTPDQAEAIRGLDGRVVTLKDAQGQEQTYKIRRFKNVDFDTEFFDTPDRKILNGGGMLRARTRYELDGDGIKGIDIESKVPPAKPSPYQDRAKGASFKSMEEWKSKQSYLLSPESTDPAVRLGRTLAAKDDPIESVAYKHSLRELFLASPTDQWLGYFKPQFILSLDTNSMRGPQDPRPTGPVGNEYHVLTPQVFTKLPWTKKVTPERVERLQDLCQQLSQEFQINEVGMSPYAEGMAHWKKG